MGEVYRALDTRLDRVVAVKVLPTNVSSDPSFRQRLEREAKAVSRLSHPHICTLHDIGQQDGADYLVMELVEGETLEQRLIRGSLPPDQTIRYSAQIADALAKAHKLGITHRDLKPANIMLTKSGAKLMDFGLAKQTVPLAAAIPEMTMEQSKLTQEGTIVGTFQYMAPEQLEGKEADARTDLFALGEVMYEMATGKPAFSGKSRASLIAAILTAEPAPLTQLQPLMPATLERIVQKCLAKDPDDRWQSASDLASELTWIGTESGVNREARARVPSLRRERIVGLIAALVIAVAAAVASYTYFYFRPKPHFSQRARWIVTPPEATTFQPTGDGGGPVVLSPDGGRMAFVARDANGKTQLWVRAIDALKAEALPGTEGATWPFWSPDSRSLGFFSHRHLMRMDASGGSALTLCDVDVPRGGTWSPDGTILFAPSFASGLYRVPASGGSPVQVTRADPSKYDSHRWPFFLPDGQHFLYFAGRHLDLGHSQEGVFVGSLDGKVEKFLLHSHSNAAYADGRLLFMKDNVIMAQPFDLGRLELVGEPVIVQEAVEQDQTWWLAVFSVSQNGLLAFAPSLSSGNQLLWLSREGKQLGTVGEPGAYAGLRLSPTGQLVAIEYEQPQNDIWIYDLKVNSSTQFTIGPSPHALPVWSPDGERIAYAAQRGPHSDLFAKSVGGAQSEEPLLESNDNKYPLDWSPDGNFLLYLLTNESNTYSELRALPMRGQSNSQLILKSPLYDSDGQFSPDTHWIAYTSREQGPQQVFATPFPGPGPRVRISLTGGSSPVWRRDGAAILYMNDSGTILEETEVQERGSELLLGKTRHLAVQTGVVPTFEGSPFDTARDGRILFLGRGEQNNTQLVMVANWSEGLKK